MTARKRLFAATKGGVGKSAYTIHGCIYSKVHLDKSTLLIELDPQGNNSAGAFIDESQIAANPDCCASRLYIENSRITPITGKFGIDVIPADDMINSLPMDLTDNDFESLVSAVQNSEDSSANTIIKNVIDQNILAFHANISELAEHYDNIFIDTPPSLLGLPLSSALSVADTVTGLLNPNKFSDDVAGKFLDKVEAIKEEFDTELEFKGFIINDLKGTNPRHKERAAQWLEQLPGLFLCEPIKHCSWIGDTAEDGEPIWKGATNPTRRGASKAILNVMSQVIS